MSVLCVSMTLVNYKLVNCLFFTVDNQKPERIQEMEKKTNQKFVSLTQDVILRALSENYECIYVVNAETSAYQGFYESDTYSSLRLKSKGEDFFQDVEDNIFKIIYRDDQEYVRGRLSKDSLREGLKSSRFYSFVYRLVIDGIPRYHKLRATTELIEWKTHYLIGIRNVDLSFRQDKAQAEELSAMRTKEMNHLEAILASADGYLEVNLTKNRVHEISKKMLHGSLPEDMADAAVGGKLLYTDFMRWNIEHLVVENKEKIRKISSRDYLLNCFAQGEKRASASFTMRTINGKDQPCRMIFYLYQDALSRDTLSFCVLYDLTEQQRKEKELKDLEHELQMSRLRNFTSQMQPHFLYNTLGSIQEIVLENPAYASELIGDFTVHLRSCIRAMSNDEPISFEQELANIKAYTNIEKMRFGEKLKVVFDIRAKDFLITPLSVQPLVENAIRHGIYKRGERGGTVSIRTGENEDVVYIVVEDDGVGFNVNACHFDISSGMKDSTGLKNISFRLEKTINASVAVQSCVGIGTKVMITIPREKKCS